MAQLKTKTNGIYYLDVRLPDDDDGGKLKRVRVSCDTRDPGEAEAQRREWLAGRHPKHPAMGGVIAPKGSPTDRVLSTRGKTAVSGMTLERWVERCLDTLWKDAKSIRSMRSNVRVLAPLLPDVLVGDVNSLHMKEIEANLRAHPQGYSEGSIRKLLRTVSSALTYAMRELDPETKQPYLAARPVMPTIKVRNVQDRVISIDEERAIFECIEARRCKDPTRPWWLFGLLLTVLLDTGFRLGEALSLGQRSVRRKRWMEAGEVKEHTYLGLDRYTTKNDKPREVPATRRVLAALPALNAQAVAGKWFPWSSQGSGAWYLWQNIRDDMALRGFDISDVRLHTFRHTCATRLAENGMDLLGLRDWLGHSDIKITAERYVHLMSSHLHKGAAILELAGSSVYPKAGAETSSGSEETTVVPLTSGNNRAVAGTPALH